MIAQAASRLMGALMPNNRLYQSSAAGAGNRAPFADFWYSSAGLPQVGGVPSENAQFFVSACFAATRLLCGIGATMPLNRMQRRTQEDGQRERIVLEDDTVHKLINLRPNRDQTAIQFRSQMVSWQVNWGVAFAEIEREMFGEQRPVGLNPIHPRRMRPFRSEDDGSLWWHVRNSSTDGGDISDADVLRLPYIVSDDGGVTGLGVKDQAQRTIGLSQTMEIAEQDANMSSVPRIVVESPKPMTQPARDAFRREWRELHTQGGENVALLVEGAKANALSWSAVDSQHSQRREFLIEEVARWYDVPLNLLRRAISDTAGNVEQTGIDFKTFSLNFLLIWPQELAVKLLTPEEQDAGGYFSFDFKSLMRGDHAARATFNNQMFAIGALNANEIREDEGMNPYDLGDKYYVQGAYRPVDVPYSNIAKDPMTGADPDAASEETEEETTETPAEQKGEGAAGENDEAGNSDDEKMAMAKASEVMCILLSDKLEHFLEKERKQVSGASSKPKEFNNFIETFYAKHEAQMQEALKPICEASKTLDKFVETSRIAAEWCHNSKVQLIAVTDTATMSTLSDDVKAKIDTWSGRVGESVAYWTSNKGTLSC